MELIKHILFTAFLTMLAGAVAYADSAPSSGAKGMPGALGTFAFTPNDHQPGVTTWWKDTDGVKPGIAGCHIGTNEQGEQTGRAYGEACLTDGLLVESNPGKDVVHSHSNDTGSPDKFDCNAWCIGTGMNSGTCVIAAAPPCDQSAVCSCK